MFRNRSTEKDVLDWLVALGHESRGAVFDECELHAIQRPGWLQVFRFEVRFMTAEHVRRHSYGALRSDERYDRLDIELFDEAQSRDQRLAEWSEGLITQRRR